MPATIAAGRRRSDAGRAAGATSVGEALALGDGDNPPAARRLELDRAGPRREDRVVAADARPVTGTEPGSALAHDDLAPADALAGEDLDPEHLRVRVAAVATRSKSLLMRHRS